MSAKMEQKITWPENCVWPEPVEPGTGEWWDPEDFCEDELDEDGRELLEIREYFDRLKETGRLNEDYSLNEDYDDEDEDSEEDGEPWEPEIGRDYWDDGFMAEIWEEDMLDHINLLKIPCCEPVMQIREIIGYDFINENLFRQAFTRRAFAMEHGLSGDSEELEFYGDMALNTIVTREICKRFADTDTIRTDAPFRSRYREGNLSKLRSRFISKEYLSSRAAALGLDRWILYGNGEEPSESAREDMMEALIGAVAVDSDWDRTVLEEVADRLLCLQLDQSEELVKESFYEQLNAWHQKHFGRMPEYVVDYRSAKGYYTCTLRYSVPENDKDIRTAQRIDTEGEETRSASREYAARRAVSMIKGNGLWMRLEDAKLIPDPENSINQLQELFQKKYVTRRPEYSFEELYDGDWRCECTCDSFEGWGHDKTKVKAKKKAAYMVLIRLLQSAGICEKEWERRMWKNI